jgi:hypothetical protein
MKENFSEEDALSLKDMLCRWVFQKSRILYYSFGTKAGAILREESSFTDI